MVSPYGGAHRPGWLRSAGRQRRDGSGAGGPKCYEALGGGGWQDSSQRRHRRGRLLEFLPLDALRHQLEVNSSAK